MYSLFVWCFFINIISIEINNGILQMKAHKEKYYDIGGKSIIELNCIKKSF